MTMLLATPERSLNCLVDGDLGESKDLLYGDSPELDDLFDCGLSFDVTGGDNLLVVSTDDVTSVSDEDSGVATTADTSPHRAIMPGDYIELPHKTPSSPRKRGREAARLECTENLDDLYAPDFKRMKAECLDAVLADGNGIVARATPFVNVELVYLLTRDLPACCGPTAAAWTGVAPQDLARAVYTSAYHLAFRSPVDATRALDQLRGIPGTWCGLRTMYLSQHNDRYSLRYVSLDDQCHESRMF